MPRGRGDAGQAAVELALALPVVVVLLLGMLQVALVGRDQLAIELAAREAARAAAVSADPAAAARLAADRVTTLRPLALAVSVGGDTVTVTVSHPSATDVALIGHLIGDVDGAGDVDDGPRTAVTRRRYGGPVDLRLSIDVVDRLPVLTLSGAVDLATVPVLQGGLLRLLADHPASASPSISTAWTRSTTPGSACCSAPPAGPARPAAIWSIVCANERLRTRFAVTGLDRAVSVTGGIAELLTS